MARAKRVLIVGDNPATADLEELVVRSEGHEVEVATGVASARDLVRLFGPDLVILGGDDGEDLIRSLRDGGVATPILVVSARVDQHQVVQLAVYDGVETTSKPFHVADLKSAIRRILNDADQTRDGAVP